MARSWPPVVVDQPALGDELLDVRPRQARPVGHEAVDAADHLALRHREPPRARAGSTAAGLGLEPALEVLVAVELALLGPARRRRARPQPSGAQSPIVGNTAIATSSTIAVEIAASATLYV